MKKHLLFPSLIYQGRIAARNLCRDLLNEIEVYQAEDMPGQKWSKKNYRHGYTSYGSRDQLFLQSPTFAALAKALDPHVTEYLQTLQYEKSERRKLVLNTMWVNVMPKGSYHTAHIHPQSVLSGTYYVEAPPGSGAIKFEDPRFTQLMNAPRVSKNAKDPFQRFFLIEPKNQEFVLFESWMRHEVLENTGSRSRVSVSFNYDWASGR